MNRRDDIVGQAVKLVKSPSPRGASEGVATYDARMDDDEASAA